MSLRRRLVVAVAAVTFVALGGGLAAVTVAVERDQLRQVDAALQAEAAIEAQEAARLEGADLEVRPRIPDARAVAALRRYAVIYARDGRVLEQSQTFHGHAPPRAALPRNARGGACFDLHHAGEHLRAVLVPVPGSAGEELFVAVPRAELEEDAAFLQRATLIALAGAVGWAVLVAAWVARRLTRGHEAIAHVARRVAAGDLSARVGTGAFADRETAQLGRDVDDMIARLEQLVNSQQRFVANAAHELRSPLTALYGELSHALRRTRDAEAYREAIEAALDSTRQLKSLAEDLLAIARVGGDSAGHDERVAPADVVRDAVERVAHEARARRVQVATPGGAPSALVVGRRADLERMLRNLLENAVRHSPQGGRVEVRTAVRDGAVEMTVADEGPGIPPEVGERVFEPFYRGARDRAASPSGAGLGLPIAREIAHAHGGELVLAPPEQGAADGRALRGARFVVRLPLAPVASG